MNFLVYLLFLLHSGFLVVVRGRIIAKPGHVIASSRSKLGEQTKYQTVFTEDGKVCKFPFRYGGSVYHRCISNSFSSRPWCATTHNFDRDQEWGICAPLPDTVQAKCYEAAHLKYYDVGDIWGRIYEGRVEQCSCSKGIIECQVVRYRGCSTNPCQNNATCRWIVATNEPVCACKPGFVGSLCTFTSNTDCFNNNGTDYRGTAHITRLGATCLRWNSDILHFNERTAEQAAQLGLGAHNFCRNLDNDESPWCYILNGRTISWEYCNIKPCQQTQQIMTVPAVGDSFEDPSESEVPELFVRVPNTTQPKTGPACGKRHKKRRAPAGRIIGGTSSLPGAHPWLAALYIGKNFCSGSLIMSCWVVSAAHCFSNSPLKSSIRVVLGQHFFNDTGPNVQTFEVDKYIFPDKYSVFNDAEHDIVLIKLKKKDKHCAKRTQFVSTICLPEPDITFIPSTYCHIAGWGHSKEGAQTYENHLQETVVPIISSLHCSSPEVYGNAITENMLCAGHLDCRRDACQGDSGGPLACEKNDIFYLYGIISWGDGCARTNKPGVYTRVSRYMDWIKSSIKPKPKANEEQMQQIPLK
ncbi:hepatocyte growth factor activator-like isoform X1 [Polypterus senegalus]|nr:hepatocyte growth factor activator-like isoform X1 [Polypterus senegalus]